MDRDQTPARPTRKRRRPDFEGLEARELLSVAAPPRIGPTPSPSFAGVTPLPHISTAFGPELNLGQLRQLANGIAAGGPAPASAFATKNLGALDVPANPTNPTAAEVARQYFIAKFQGSYTIGAGRNAGQALTIHAVSRVQGGSNQFLKGKAQFILFTPSATPPPDVFGGTTATIPAASTSPVTGVVALLAQNYLQSGSSVIIDVGQTNQPPTSGSTPIQAGGPTVLSDVNGLMLPTQTPWAFDTTSAGAYTAPAGFTSGGGQMSIRYTPDPHPKGGNLGSGKVEFLLQGVINTSSILNNVDKGFN